MEFHELRDIRVGSKVVENNFDSLRDLRNIRKNIVNILGLLRLTYQNLLFFEKDFKHEKCL